MVKTIQSQDNAIVVAQKSLGQSYSGGLGKDVNDVNLSSRLDQSVKLQAQTRQIQNSSTRQSPGIIESHKVSDPATPAMPSHLKSHAKPTLLFPTRTFQNSEITRIPETAVREA